MKKILIGVASFLVTSLVTDAQVSETFTDGNTTVNPTWGGDNSKFEIDGNGALHLLDVGAGTAQLTTSSNAINNAVWEFDAHLDFNPSTSNFASVYLVSNSTDLTASLNGYFVQIGGESGSVDSYDLYKQVGTTVTKIIDGTEGLAATNPNSKIKVTRDSLGNWTLYVDTTKTGTNYLPQGTVLDNEIKSGSNFGFYLKYSSTRKDKFYFDNITVTGSGANQPPVAKSVSLSLDKSSSISLDLNAISSDPENGTLKFAITTNSGKGSSIISGDNVLYTPFSSSEGLDSLKYSVCDAYDDCDTGSITVVYNPNGVSAKLVDAFTDKDYSENPEWSGSSMFVVDSLDRLQLKDTAAGASYLVTPSTVISDAAWEFDVKLDFSPSGSNYAKVYLVSNASDLSGDVTGYYVQVGGESGAIDSYDLFKQEGAVETKLIDGVEGLAATNPNAKVRVTKSAAGVWYLSVDTTKTGKSYIVQGKGSDNTITSSKYFGIYTKYSGTRADKMYFDNINIDGNTSVPTAVNDVNFDAQISVNNPFNQTLVVNFNQSTKTNTEVRLLNATGNLLVSVISNGGQVIFNTSSYTAGIYYVQTINSGNVSAIKVVKLN